MFLNLLRILQLKKYKRICKRKFCKSVKSTHEAKISTRFKTSVKIREGFMMNFCCTISFQELSLPTFFQGKKKRFEKIFWCVKLKENGLYALLKGLHPNIPRPYVNKLLLITSCQWSLQLFSLRTRSVREPFRQFWGRFCYFSKFWKMKWYDNIVQNLCSFTCNEGS